MPSRLCLAALLIASSACQSTPNTLAGTSYHAKCMPTEPCWERVLENYRLHQKCEAATAGARSRSMSMLNRTEVLVPNSNGKLVRCR